MKITPFNQYINEEAGMRNLNSITKKYKEFEIWLHQDLDGVTSALAMKTFLETYYNLKMVDCHIIQYGELEYAVKGGRENTLKILVDFANSKPLFHIATDHHDHQTGSEDNASTYFKGARSNVETISGEISYNEIFTDTDLQLIRTVDSADFLKHNITPHDISNSIFNYDKTQSPERNRFMMGFVVNRLLLAYKNKRLTVKSLNQKNKHKNKNILECLVMDSKPSLYSLFNNLKHYIKKAKTNDKAGKLATPEEIEENLKEYVKQMKNYGKDSITNNDLKVLSNLNNKKEHQLPYIAKDLNISIDELKNIIKKLMDEKLVFFTKYNNYFVGDKGQRLLKQGVETTGIDIDDKYKIITQFGGGNMFKPGSYDRYTPFKNYPEANFLAIVWSLGLIQVSCNPFKKKKLEFINLGNIANIVLNRHKNNLKRIFISIKDIKKEYETSSEWTKLKKIEGEDYKGVGFKFSDLKAFYINDVHLFENNKNINIDVSKDEKFINILNKHYNDLTSEELEYISVLRISSWDIIKKNSGGHPSITNISSLNFLKYNPRGLVYFYKSEKYMDFVEMLAHEMVNELKKTIDDNTNTDDIKKFDEL